MKKSTSGFTIVELLIVIVVIAILATISIVAYNGIQQRARNAQIVSGVKIYEKAILSYAAVNGSYPTISGQMACLGANYPSSQCWTGPSGNATVNTTLDTALADYINSKPVVSTRPLTITSIGDVRQGAVYRFYSQTNVEIVYYLEGAGRQCLNGSTGASEREGTQCRQALPIY
jgi:prepilin-type N-terminal cleavage/methylation domain-containing protein